MATVAMSPCCCLVLFLALICNNNLVLSSDNEESNKILFDKVLEHINLDINTKYTYGSRKIIETHILDSATHFLVDVTTACPEDISCGPLSLICQGVLEKDTLSKVKCFIQEDLPPLPNYGQGFIVKRSNKFVEGVLDHGLQKLVRDGGPQRKVIEIISVKKRETSGTELFITAKVAAGSEEGGDLLELEMCEVASLLGSPGSMQILDSEAKCFPLVDDSEVDHLGGTLVTPEELSSRAQWALHKINVATDVTFNYTLVEIMKADASSTPGSGGLLTTMQLRLSPSYCPKNNNDPEITWDCSPSGQPLICTVAAWERPWRGDTLMSRPRCKRLPLAQPSRTARAPGSEDSTEIRPVICTGCVEEVNTDNPQVTELATSALGFLNAGKLSATPHQLIRVVSIHRQVVNGIRYILNVELTACQGDATPCVVAEGSPVSLTCRLELLEGAVDRQRNLLSSHCEPLDKKEESSEAAPTTPVAEAAAAEDKTEVAVSLAEVPAQTEVEAPKSENDKTSTEEKDDTQRREKRSTNNRPLGSYQDVDMEKEGPLIRELATVALNNIDDIDDDKSRRKLLQVVKAKKQVTNGYTYQLSLRVGVMPPCDEGADCTMPDNQMPSLLCTVWVHRTPVNNQNQPQTTRVMRSECEPEGSAEIQEAPARPTTPPSSRKRRSAPGGNRPADVNDPYIREIAQFSLTELDRASNALYTRQVVRVVSAERQVVSGTLNHLTLELAYSNCRKGSSANEVCSLQEELDRELCTVAVWDRPWLNDRRMQNFSCNPISKNKKKKTQRTKRETAPRRNLLGGRNPANVSDPYIQEIAQFSLVELDRVSNSLYNRQIVKVVSAEKQVVSGVMSHLTLELGYSNCRKGASENEICSLQEEVDREICTVSVWDRPWLKSKSIQNFSCVPIPKEVTRRKRETQLIGRGTHDVHIGLFREYMTKHDKHYSTEEEFRKRFHIFRANLKKIQTLQDTELGTATYGPTQFADLTVQEFKQKHLGLKPELKEKGKMKLKKAVVPDIKLPDEFDWRHYNVVTPVKNQGACGSCWAFSVTGNVEGQWALRRGQLVSLSEQELVDCDSLDSGCNGGLPSNAYEALQKLGGLEAEGDYPYDGQDETCHFNKSEVRATVTGGLNITTNETMMAQWLVKNGPISIGINANAMQFYYGGVSHPWKMLCDPTNLDHGVLIVGFGVHISTIRHRRMPYWIVKNSWGRGWGEQGYYRVYRGDGTCGVNQMATSAIVG